MAKVKFNAPQAEEKFVSDKPSGMCVIHGCPRAGTIIQDGRRNCPYHWNRSGTVLHAITLALKNYATLFNWHEKLINFTVVDWDSGDVERIAPIMYQVQQGESWSGYKKRIKSDIDKLLQKGHRHETTN